MTCGDTSAGALSYWSADDVFVLVSLSNEPVHGPNHDGALIAGSPLAEALDGQGQPLSGPGGDAPGARFVPPGLTVWLKAVPGSNGAAE